MGLGGGVWTAVRAELLRPGFKGADAMRTGAKTDTEAGGLADTADFAALPSFAGGAVTTPPAGLTGALAIASAGFLAAELIAFFTSSAALLAGWAVAAACVLAAAWTGIFLSGAFTIVSPLEAA